MDHGGVSTRICMISRLLPSLVYPSLDRSGPTPGRRFVEVLATDLDVPRGFC